MLWMKLKTRMLLMTWGRHPMKKLLSNALLKENLPLMAAQTSCISHKTEPGTDSNTPYPSYVSGKGDLVYVGTMAGMVKGVKAFSLSTSFLGILAQPYLYTKAASIPTILKFVVGGTLGFYVFVTPLVLHWITKRYVVNMYYDESKRTFAATTYTFFLRKRDFKFEADEVVRPAVAGLFTSFKVQGKPLFVDPSLFTDKSSYIALMGYDKPIDWEIKAEDVEHDKKKN